MGTTEGMLMWWLVECGAVSGAILGAIIGRLMAAHERKGAGYSAICGMAAMGGNAIITALLGLVLGCTVHLVDVAGDPGVFRGAIYALLGFLVGGISGIVPSIVGGFIGGLFIK